MCRYRESKKTQGGKTEEKWKMREDVAGFSCAKEVARNVSTTNT